MMKVLYFVLDFHPINYYGNHNHENMLECHEYQTNRFISIDIFNETAFDELIWSIKFKLFI